MCCVASHCARQHRLDLENIGLHIYWFGYLSQAGSPVQFPEPLWWCFQDQRLRRWLHLQMWRRWEKAREGLTEHKKVGIGLPSDGGFVLEVRITSKGIYWGKQESKTNWEKLEFWWSTGRLSVIHLCLNLKSLFNSAHYRGKTYFIISRRTRMPWRNRLTNWTPVEILLPWWVLCCKKRWGDHISRSRGKQEPGRQGGEHLPASFSWNPCLETPLLLLIRNPAATQSVISMLLQAHT